jgi:hypothetical protein
MDRIFNAIQNIEPIYSNVDDEQARKKTFLELIMLVINRKK